MKKYPILMNSGMVRATLAGQKTQTRRIVKPQPDEVGFGKSCEVGSYCTGTPWPLAYYERRGGCWNSGDALKCPFGRPGNRLWVREAWQSAAAMNVCHEVDDYIIYRATDPDWGAHEGWKWRPSIHMPRRASRITLEITGVRAERVRDISEADARAEGIVDGGCTNCGESEPCWCDHPNPDARDAFCHLWMGIYGPESWAANPWVWVIEYRRVPQCV